VQQTRLLSRPLLTQRPRELNAGQLITPLYAQRPAMLIATPEDSEPSGVPVAAEHARRLLRPMECNETPPEFGLLEFEIDIAPVSLQGKGKRRRLVQSTVGESTKQAKWLLSGEVKVSIEWLVRERLRYETGTSPDVDNIIKPLLDAICGPHGIMIDDCQVQSIQCNWIDWNRSDQRVRYELRFAPDDFVLKEGLIFVGIGDNLYMPLHTTRPREAQILLLEHWPTRLAMAKELEVLTGDYYAARDVMPIQRPFHVSHLGDFPRVSCEELMEQLLSEADSRINPRDG
jgi:Holliday junction resolvase RusA-like endonuclease